MPSSKPLCGYRRLSVDRNGNKIGYEVQTEAGESWAQSSGHTIAHWYEDRNETAADENVRRDDYEQMLLDVAAGVYGGILVWRVDRLTRIDSEFLRILKIVKGVGGEIYSVHEGSTETDDNIISLKLKVLLGDHEVKSSKRRISANKQQRKKKGLYTGGGRRPYGFEAPVHDEFGRVVNVGRVGVAHVPHEVANLQAAAKRIAWDGDRYLDVVNDWHSAPEPIYGATGAPWNTKTLATLLTSPRMIGMQEVTEDGETTLMPAVWEPVLDERTWRRLVSLKGKAAYAYSARETYLLTNIASCGRCGMPLSGSQRKYEKGGAMVATPGYRCPSGAPYKARGHCGRLNVIAEPVENIVVAHVLVRLLRTRGVMESVGRPANDVMDEIDAVEKEMQAARDQLLEIESTFSLRKIKLDQFLRLQAPVQEEIEGLDRKAKVLAAKLESPTPAGSDWTDLPRWFEGLSGRQKRELVRAHIAGATVLPPGRSGRYFRKDRVVVVPLDIPLADPQEADA